MKDLQAMTHIASCDTCRHEAGEPRTIYVHLCSGLVTEVAAVTELHVTDTQLVLARRGDQPAVFARRDVYFACCEADEAPSPC